MAGALGWWMAYSIAAPPGGVLRRIGRGVVRLFWISEADAVLTGLATVIDGDSIIVAGKSVRLHGIDAPELDQTFLWRGRRTPCGTMALAALEALTAGIRLRCQPVDRDRHGRIVAKCFSPAGIDINRRMVSAGWALAYRRYSTDYVDAEDEARLARRGMWKGSFISPWDWRRSTPRPAQRA